MLKKPASQNAWRKNIDRDVADAKFTTPRASAASAEARAPALPTDDVTQSSTESGVIKPKQVVIAKC